MEPFLLKKQKQKNQKISKYLKKSQNISKYLKISLMLFFKRGFVRLGSVLHIFLDHRKSQKNSKNLKKIKTSQTNLKISQICWKKNKKTRNKKEKNK